MDAHFRPVLASDLRVDRSDQRSDRSVRRRDPAFLADRPMLVQHIELTPLTSQIHTDGHAFPRRVILFHGRPS